MMLHLTLLLLVLPFISALPPSPPPIFSRSSPLVTHESRSSPPRGFVLKSPAPEDTEINLRIALVQPEIASLEQVLYDVSTPGNKLYGQHLSKAELKTYTSPSPSSLPLITSWLASAGLTPSSLSGNWLTTRATIAQASALLNTSFSLFHNEHLNLDTVRTLSYKIPEELSAHVKLVHPTVSFPGHPSRRPTISATGKAPLRHQPTPPPPHATCNQTITPACLQALYGIPSKPFSPAQSTNQLAVSGFINQFPNKADLSAFLQHLRPDIDPNTTFALQEIDKGKDPQGKRKAGVEANLDIEYTIGVATGVPVTFISVGNKFQDGALDGFLDIINFMLGEDDPPQVLTTSYGEDEDLISPKLAVELCNAYMQLGARGVSILFASGDSGVGADSGNCTTFVPQFPSGCPFLTSVGATQFIPETSASFSSGGFSNVFAQPAYQSAAVSSYLSFLGSKNAGLFNATSRAFPDVSAIGHLVEIVSGGRTGLVDGTSCSSPIFASIVSLINEELIAGGKSPLGFLNPWLYGVAHKMGAFTDITKGNNPGCGTDGFPATTGWDPVTGLGTPIFEKLRAAAGLT